MPTPTAHPDDARTTRALIARRYIETIGAGEGFEQDLYATPLGVVIETIDCETRQPCCSVLIGGQSLMLELADAIVVPSSHNIAALIRAMREHVSMLRDLRTVDVVALEGASA